MAVAGTQVLGGRYALRSVLGSGGMAIVWRATDQVLDREVAVKVLSPQYAADPAFLARFKAEARNAASLSSSRIVTIFDWGVDNGTPYLVMELASGTTLRQVIDEAGALPVAQAVSVAMAVCDALDCAHAAGLVHRDIKPANIVLSGREVKVLDFGIAKAALPTGSTRTQGVLGTPAYLSPEQASGAAVGPQADLYSLGCMLFEMLTGGPPFPADSEVGVAYRHVHDEPVRPSALRPDLPDRLADLTVRLLAKKPDDRPAGAAVARAELAASLTPDQTSLLMVPAGDSRPARPGRRAGRRWRRSETVLAMCLVAALAAVVVVLLTGPPAARPTTSGQLPHQHQKQPGAARITSTTPARADDGSMPTTARAAGAIVADLLTGMTNGQVSEQAEQNLVNQLQQLLIYTPRQDSVQIEQQYAQLLEQYDQYRTQRQLTGQAAVRVRQQIGILGVALNAG
jgi:eukaryotic-like serine/threonine-protein kinase